ncbi:RcnB family protein [Sphingomonas immobilis]|uniref:RcnB family protein n=1 Tax=Sphingomonas immobilis TaxID=3063997 RepID=A0ABT8ZUU1_9SPHN|nr:RcnB family protein [Sphingomonas sp. CA1-15]MDO7841348.1 RcnB family protein [Sphingomonas sp. CA1-15]
MRKLIVTALLAASVLPVAAQAQSPGELRRDRQDIREERRDLDRAYRSGDRDRIRDERGDLRDARQEYREDVNDRNRQWARDDWRRYRDRDGSLYAAGNWRAPFRYTAFRTGIRIAPVYWGTRYVINDPWRYRLPPARWGQRWVRHYNDVILVDTRRGVVVDVIRGFYR